MLFSDGIRQFAVVLDPLNAEFPGRRPAIDEHAARAEKALEETLLGREPADIGNQGLTRGFSEEPDGFLDRWFVTIYRLRRRAYRT